MVNLPVPFEYDRGYIVAYTPHRLTGLSAEIMADGTRLVLKPKLHITLICTKKIAELIDPVRKDIIEAEIVAHFNAFIQDYDATQYELTDSFRFVVQGEQKSIIVMIKMPVIKEFFDSLSRRYGRNLPLQPAHITLYVLPGDHGIALSSQAELERDSKAIDIHASR